PSSQRATPLLEPNGSRFFSLAKDAAAVNFTAPNSLKVTAPDSPCDIRIILLSCKDVQFFGEKADVFARTGHLCDP
ncbi:MAG: hypothetical protein ACPIC3_03045, partial [Candidatus Puniceispirillaceae bacterium]